MTTRETNTCPLCRGTGACAECNGLGILTCVFCDRRGCRECDNTGSVVCVPCDGRGQCWRCGGLGDLPTQATFSA